MSWLSKYGQGVESEASEEGRASIGRPSAATVAEAALELAVEPSDSDPLDPSLEHAASDTAVIAVRTVDMATRKLLWRVRCRFIGRLWFVYLLQALSEPKCRNRYVVKKAMNTAVCGIHRGQDLITGNGLFRFRNLCSPGERDHKPR